MRHSLIPTILWYDLFRFSRRTGRFEYWWGLALCWLIYPALAWLPLALVVGMLVDSGELLWSYRHGPAPELWATAAAGFAGIAALVHSGIAWISLMVRRLHDLGHSGLFALFAFAGVPGVILSVAIGFARGESGPNRWGEHSASWPPERRVPPPPVPAQS